MGVGELVGGLLDHCGWCDDQSRPSFLPSSALIGMLFRAILRAKFSCPLGQDRHDVTSKYTKNLIMDMKRVLAHSRLCARNK
jgi:hypothetical protein